MAIKKTTSSNKKEITPETKAEFPTAPRKSKSRTASFSVMDDDIFRLLFENSPIGIEIFDKEGFLVNVNRSGLANYGVADISELKGFSFFDDPMFPDDMKEMLRKGEGVRREAVFDFDKANELGLFNTEKTGTIVLDLLFTPIIVGKGGPVGGYLVQVQDITDRKRVEKELGLFSSAVKYAMDGIQVVDLDGHILYSNGAVEDIYGFTGEELKGMHVNNMNVDREFAGREILPSVRSNGRWDGEIIVKHKQGHVFPIWLSTSIVKDSDGRPIAMVGIIRDITERKDAETKLKESEDRFRTIFEQATDGLLIADLEDKKQIEANKAICKMLGYTREELLSIYVEDLHPKEDLPRVIDYFERQTRGEISLAPDLPMLRKDGRVIHVDVNSTPIVLNGKKCLVGFFRDITERKQADAALRERERQLSESQRIGRIGSWEHNVTTGEVVWSDELFRLLGLDPEKDPADFNMFFEKIHPDDQPALKKAIGETLETGSHFSIEYRYVLGDGRTRTFHAQAELISDKTDTQRILCGTGQDITERKEAEARIMEALREKEVLLKEIHHRVKNNMAIVSAMLKLQSRHTNDSRIKKILEDSQSRIDSMAMVHEKLYASENISSIMVRDYVKELIHHLLDTYTTRKIRVEIEVDDIELDIDHIIPLGLILNELLTNSLKHAFLGDVSPEIRISLMTGEGTASLTYRDNGTGLPEGLELSSAQSLGLKIIYMLSYQLKGSVHLDVTDRSKYILSFPI